MRIIGGKWRGRKLRFRGDASLRPTLGRTRETLFNWLRGELHGATCLDLFAGSGALGFEALSQGAAHVTMVEAHAGAATSLKANRAQLDCEDVCEIRRFDAERYLRQLDPTTSFDIAFLDPPFDRPELATSVVKTLTDAGHVSRHIYLESRAPDLAESLAKQVGWQVDRTTRSGDTHATLLIPGSGPI